ncbi:MAG: hypothetical protein H7124_18020 [Phycisphaerales bacterium]|nr:hypothetical protein [Hyphomonadaceae bacterium]
MKRAAIVLASIIAACSPTRTDRAITIGFEELGSEATNRSGSYNYRTAVNVTGVSLPYSVGAMASNPGPDLPELLALPQSYGCSKIVETIYPFSGTAADVGTVGRAIDRAAAALAAQTAVQLRLQILDGAVRRADQIRAAESDADQAATQIQSDRAISAARRALGGMADFTTETVQAKHAELNGALAQANTAQGEATNELRTARTQPNLLVFRWSAQESQEAGLQLGQILGLSSRRGQERTGYVVLAGVRTAAFSPGADMVWATELARQVPEMVDRTFGERLVTTFTLGAQHVAFSEDRNWSTLLRADLNLSASEMALLVGGDVGRLLSSQSLQLEAALSAIVGASSQGAITTPQRTLYDFRMTGPDARQYSAWQESQRNGGYSIIYSTRTTIEDAARATNGRSHRVSRRFLASDQVYRCVHSIQAIGLGSGEVVAATAGASMDAAPQMDGETAPVDEAQQAIRSEGGRLAAAETLLFCLPDRRTYQRDPFASVRPEGDRTREEDDNLVFPRCVALNRPYSPNGNDWTTVPFSR